MSQSNWSQKIYFLALQKYLSFGDLVETLSLSQKEIISIAKEYGREYCRNQERYINRIMTDNIYRHVEIVGYISKRRWDTISIDEMTEIFNMKREELLTLISTLLSKYPKIGSMMGDFRLKLKKELMDHEAKAKESSDFRDWLITNSKFRPIEELALDKNLSPHQIESSLLELGAGGFWFNENIRINGPFFVGYTNLYSPVEWLYLLDNIDEELDLLAVRLHTSHYNIKMLVDKIKFCGVDKEDIKKTIKGGKDHLVEGWAELYSILDEKKDNGEFIKKYRVSQLFNTKEINQLDRIGDHYLKRINNLVNNRVTNDSQLVIDKKGDSTVGDPSFESENYRAFRQSDSKIFFVDDGEIFAYRKLK